MINEYNNNIKSSIPEIIIKKEDTALCFDILGSSDFHKDDINAAAERNIARSLNIYLHSTGSSEHAPLYLTNSFTITAPRPLTDFISGSYIDSALITGS